MLVITSLEDLRAEDFSQGSAVAVGKFDGVHLGHRAIISSMLREAEQHGLVSVVFTFRNNPLSYLNPSICPKPLSSAQQRIEQLEAAGVDVCVMVEFDQAFSEIPAESFIDDVLVKQLHAQHVTLGSDFRFGHRGAGDGALLREHGRSQGFAVEVVESITDDAKGVVSSSRIREALNDGDVALVAEMLGRPYAVRGTVVHGDARGRELGFPTANVGGNVEGFVPADGVYAGAVIVDGVERVAAISVGVNLTFDPEGEPRVEAFILDFEGDLYGKRIEVVFVQRIRPMLPFDSAEALVERMHEDVAETRRILARR